VRITKQKIRPRLCGRKGQRADASATHCHRPVKSRSHHSSASRIACGRGIGSRSIFCLESGWSRGARERVEHPRPGPPGASTFPRIWNRSINACKNAVKGKTRDVVDYLVRRLFVVVVLHERAACRLVARGRIQVLRRVKVSRRIATCKHLAHREPARIKAS
jgi:hypothetical protein